ALNRRQRHGEGTIISERIDQIGFGGTRKCRRQDRANPLPVGGRFGTDFNGGYHSRFKWFQACLVWLPAQYMGEVAALLKIFFEARLPFVRTGLAEYRRTRKGILISGWFRPGAMI